MLPLWIIKYALPLKALACIAVATFAYWWIWSTGVEHERAKWEIRMSQERDRQEEILVAAREAGYRAAAALDAAEDERNTLLRRLQDDARNAVNADDACLDADSILRLNTIRSD